MAGVGARASFFKTRYRSKWKQSNARERFVKLFLDVYLPQGFEARLTGLGAGSSELIPRTYRGAREAFDITVYFNGAPVAFVEVTGIDYDKKPLEKLGYCVGEWKLEKASRHGVEDRVWIAFVVEAWSRILWAPATKFYTSLAKKAKLYEDERNVYCLPIKKWHPFYRPDWRRGPVPFLTWLQAAATKPLITPRG